MLIEDVRPWPVANPPPHHGAPCCVFVKLTAGTGADGYGEAYEVPFGAGKVQEKIENVAERYASGQSRSRSKRSGE